MPLSSPHKDWLLTFEVLARRLGRVIVDGLPLFIRAGLSADEPVCLSIKRLKDHSATLEFKHEFAHFSGTETGAREGLLSIDSSLLYISCFEMPLIRMTEAEHAFKLEAAQRSPLPLDQAYVACRPFQKDYRNGRMDVEMFVGKLALIKKAVNMATQAEVEISGIVTEFRDRTVFLGLVPEARWNRLRLFQRQRLVLVRLAITIILVFIVLASPMLLFRSIALRQASKLAVAQALAQSSEPQVRLLSLLADQLAVLDRAARNRRSIAVLADLTRLLPDSAWITEVAIDEDHVRLHGYAKDPTSILEAIAQSRLLVDPKFSGPVIHSETNSVDEFDATAELINAS